MKYQYVSRGKIKTALSQLVQTSQLGVLNRVLETMESWQEYSHYWKCNKRESYNINSQTTIRFSKYRDSCSSCNYDYKRVSIY